MRLSPYTPGVQLVGGGASAGNGLTPLAQITASGDASVDFDAELTNAFGVYLITGTGINPATDNDFWCRTDSAGGASYDAGAADYFWALNSFGGTTNNSDDDGGAGDSKINLTGTAGGSASSVGGGAAESAFLRLWICNPSETTYNKLIGWELDYLNASGQACAAKGTGCRANTVAIDSIQLLMASGNMDGVFRLYGVQNS